MVILDVAIASFPVLGFLWSLRYSRLVWQLRRGGLRVPGHVVYQREWQQRGRMLFVPTVQFTTQAGELVEVEHPHEQALKPFVADQPVAVCYDPAAPHRFLFAKQVASQEAYWFSLLWLLVACWLTGREIAHQLA